jgi:hypothetical protein
LSFQGHFQRFSRGPDSLIAYYDPNGHTLSLVGSTSPGPAAPDNLLSVIDSVPSDGSYRVAVPHHLSYLGVTFYQTPGSDSSLVFPFTTAPSASDQVTLDLLDFSTCQVRGTLQATLYYPNDPTAYPVRAVFWGRMLWNAVIPGPC